MAVFGSSGRHANPLGIVSIMAGLARRAWVLGLVGLSYPLLTWLKVFSGPLRPGSLE